MIPALIAIDAMGGDHAPEEIVQGALLALQEFSDIHLFLVGLEESIREVFARASWSDFSRVQIVHAPDVVGMGDAPVEAMRKKVHSSIQRGLDLVREKSAQALVSAGSTGAVVAACTLNAELLPRVKRPGIGVLFPQRNGTHALLIDAGANMESKPIHLLQYAAMGQAYWESLYPHSPQRPRLGLLNIGTEPEKGNQLIKKTETLLNQYFPNNFSGYVEGQEIFDGKVDIIVCEGFVGNTVLKVGEGCTEFLMTSLQEELGKNGATAGGQRWGPVLQRVKARLDYAQYGGAPLLGAKSIYLISHGRSRSFAIFNALRQARNLIQQNMNERMSALLENLPDNSL